jgi:hypothetical protein
VGRLCVGSSCCLKNSEFLQVVDDWGVFLREAREAGPKTLLSCCYSRCTPIMQKSWPKSSLGLAWVALCDGAWACALTKLLPASLHRDERFSTKHRSLLGSGRLREWELMQEQSQKKGVGCGLQLGTPYPRTISTTPTSSSTWGERPCSIGHTMLMATIYFRSWLQIPRALGGMSLV